LRISDVIHDVGDNSDEYHQCAEQTEDQWGDESRAAAAQGECAEADDDEAAERR
jgi:hypothetical protein